MASSKEDFLENIGNTCYNITDLMQQKRIEHI